MGRPANLKIQRQRIGIKDRDEKSSCLCYVSDFHNYLNQTRRIAFDGVKWFYQPNTRSSFIPVSESDVPKDVKERFEKHLTVLRNEYTLTSKEMPVIFRKWPDGSIIALFPTLANDRAGRSCLSYEHVGQHAKADLTGVIQSSKPANESEYKKLYDELTELGYKLKVYRRATKHHRKEMLESLGK